MTRSSRLALALLAGSAAGASTIARAEPPNPRATPVYVLAIETDDADDQADALTQALRLRIRQAPGWSLLDAQQSLETLAIALKCPAKPDAPCLQRIGDQIHADHFMWGTMSHKKAGEVRAEVHLWSRGKGDTASTESFSDNVKEAADPSLQSIAGRLVGALTGSGSGGVLVIHAGRGGGAVLVDGAERAALDGGAARVEVPEGVHAVSVRVPGFEAPSQRATVEAGAEQDVSFALGPAAPAAMDGGPSSTFPLRNVAGYSALVVGAGVLVAGGVEAARWVNDKNASDNDRKNVSSGVSDVCATARNESAVDACNKSKDAVTASTLAWVLGGLGVAVAAVGVTLLASDVGSSRSRSTGRDLQVLPAVGARGGAVDVRLTF